MPLNAQVHRVGRHCWRQKAALLRWSKKFLQASLARRRAGRHCAIVSTVPAAGWESVYIDAAARRSARRSAILLYQRTGPAPEPRLGSLNPSTHLPRCLQLQNLEPLLRRVSRWGKKRLMLSPMGLSWSKTGRMRKRPKRGTSEFVHTTLTSLY